MSKKTISSVVKELRKDSGLPASRFAKLHKISRPVLAKYESGEYDCPTPLVAANYCEKFNIDPMDLIDEYTLSNKANFNKDDFYSALCEIVYKEEYKSYSELFNVKAAKLLSLNKYKDVNIPEYSIYSIDCETTYTNAKGELIGFLYFVYNKVHINESVLHAYNVLAKSISDNIFKPVLLMNDKGKSIGPVNNFLYVTPSEDAFLAVIKETKDNYFKYKNNKPVNNIISPVNITILYLPKWKSETMYYYEITGKDFICIEKYHYSE